MDTYPIKFLGDISIYGDWDENWEGGQFIVHHNNEGLVNILFLSGGYSGGGGVSTIYLDVKEEDFKKILGEFLPTASKYRSDEFEEALIKAGYQAAWEK